MAGRAPGLFLVDQHNNVLTDIAMAHLGHYRRILAGGEDRSLSVGSGFFLGIFRIGHSRKPKTALVACSRFLDVRLWLDLPDGILELLPLLGIGLFSNGAFLERKAMGLWRGCDPCGFIFLAHPIGFLWFAGSLVYLCLAGRLHSGLRNLLLLLRYSPYFCCISMSNIITRFTVPWHGIFTVSLVPIN